MPLIGMPVLSLIICRLKTSRLLSEILVATTIRAEDDAVAQVAAGDGVRVYRGGEDDVLGRNVSAIFTAAPELAYQAVVNYMPMILRQPDGITAQQFTSLAEKIRPPSK